MSHNKLKKLPDSLGDLAMLQTLDVSHNGLKELPESLSKLNRLKTLDLSHNPKLKKLPKSLAHCRSIDKLVIEAGNSITYPPTNVCSEGTEAVMKFLCKGIFYSIRKIGVSQGIVYCVTAAMGNIP